jgi:hypothetical protein
LPPAADLAWECVEDAANILDSAAGWFILAERPDLADRIGGMADAIRREPNRKGAR